MKHFIEHSSVRNLICVMLATIFFGATTLEARIKAESAVPAGRPNPVEKTKLKERILEVPPGAMIELRLFNKEKIRGRLAEVSDEGISLTTAQGDKIQTQMIAFSDVKSFKRVEGNKAGHGLLWAFAGIGIAVVALTVVGVAMAGSE